MADDAVSTGVNWLFSAAGIAAVSGLLNKAIDLWSKHRTDDRNAEGAHRDAERIAEAQREEAARAERAAERGERIESTAKQVEATTRLTAGVDQLRDSVEQLRGRIEEIVPPPPADFTAPRRVTGTNERPGRIR